MRNQISSLKGLSQVFQTSAWGMYRVVLDSKKEQFFLLQCSDNKLNFNYNVGLSGGAMVLGKLPVPGRPTNLDLSRARAYCACNRCGWGCLDIFSLVCHLFSFSLSLGDSPI